MAGADNPVEHIRTRLGIKKKRKKPSKVEKIHDFHLGWNETVYIFEMNSCVDIPHRMQRCTVFILRV